MIITFYSFKGGVGRSMALANVAELMAQRGLRVLMIDFDLEAPGLERFFDDPYALVNAGEVVQRRGLIDLLTSYRELRTLPSLEPPPADGAGGFAYSAEPIESFVVAIRRDKSSGGSLSLLPAGRRAGAEYTRYADRVRSFSWDDFYARFDGEEFFEWFRLQVETLADVVLVDSRTGITELSGVCTFHLADIVVMLAAPNQQNIEGCRLIGQGLSNPRLVTEGRGGRELRLLPVPGRVERSESELLAWFADEFARQLGLFVPDQLNFENSPFVDLQIPYVPRYAYLETVAVREPNQPAAAEMIAAFRRLVNALVQLAPRHTALSRAFALREESDDAALAPLPHDFVPRPALLARFNEWLTDQAAPPLLLVTGALGTGKSALIRWLAHLGAVPGDRESDLRAAVVLTYDAAAEQAGARQFVESLVVRLAQRVPAYAAELTKLQDRYQGLVLDVRQTISASSASATSAAQLQSLSIGTTDPRSAYDALIAAPMSRLDLRGRKLLVLVDALDEAADDDREPSILRLLADIATTGSTGNLRFLVASRPVARIFAALGLRHLDLTEGPGTADPDIDRYATNRLADLATDRRAATVDRVVALSAGNFLVAGAVIDELRAGAGAVLDAGHIPAGLAKVYERQTRLARVARGADVEPDAELLGVLAVAQAPLSRQQLVGIGRYDRPALDRFLRAWSGLIVERADETCALAHPTLAGWLRQSNLLPIRPALAHTLIGRYFANEYLGGWRDCQDPYALRYTVRHLAAAGGDKRRSTRDSLARDLALVVGDPTFRAAKATGYGRSELLNDLVDAINVLLPDLFAEFGGVATMLRSALDLKTLLRSAIVASPALQDEARPVEDLPALLGRELAHLLAALYEQIRAAMPSSNRRTATLDSIVAAVRGLAESAPWLPFDVDALLRGSDGERVMALAVCQARPETAELPLVLDSVGSPHSAFEQYHALVAIESMMPLLDDRRRQTMTPVLRGVLADDTGGLRRDSDTARSRLVAVLLREISTTDHDAAS
jgi:hypothetical protein